jgi:serine/threonine-protein kinase
MEEALIEAHSSQELDPGSVSVRRGLGYVYFYARRYDQAKYHLLRAVEMNPLAEETYRVLGLILAYSNEFDEAERVLKEALELPGAATYTRVTLAVALARAGKPEYARETLAALEERLKQDYVSPVELATVHIALGQNDHAIDWIEKAYAERRGWMAYLNVHPIVDPLRNEPRFKVLVRKMGL